MDSLTQIILGAATGELAGGKKIGRKAMFWGAVAGTIPDMDLMVGGLFKEIGFMDDMDALAFHRGISHSFFFAILAPLILGRIVDWHYKNPNRRYVSYIGSVLVFMQIAFSLNFVVYEAGGQRLNMKVITGTMILGALVVFFLYRRFFKRTLNEVNGSWKIYAWVFFWAIFTHPLLDCCTAYGTQLFQPFSDYRVAFNNIAVADPMYTVPFALCILFAAFFLKNQLRKYLSIAGIVISSFYMLWTFYNKYQVDKVIEQSLAAQNIPYDRYTSGPTLFNNFLWNCIADSDSVYYQAYYSTFDEVQKIKDWNVYPKSRHLIKGHEKDKSIQTLDWFTGNYLIFRKVDDSHLHAMDMRYGMMGKAVRSEEDFVLRFVLEEKEGILEASEYANRPPVEEETLTRFFNRIKGIKNGDTND